MLFVGDDWAEAHHDVEIQDDTGRRLARRRLPEGVAGMAVLHALIADHLGDGEPGEVVVGIETDRGAWVQALVAAGYQVYAINPLSVARYRERHVTSGAKSDAGDAKVLADLVRTDRQHHRPIAGDSDLAEAIKVLARAHQNLIWSRQRQANALRSTLREFYPAALAAFDELAGRDALAVLALAPTPTRGRTLSQAKIAAVLRRAGRQRNVDSRAEAIRAALRSEQLAAPVTVELAFGHTVTALVRVLAELTRQIEALEGELVAHFDRHPDAEIYRSLPGLGAILAARVLAEFGDDPTRFADAKARRNYAATSPITRASGTRRIVLARVAANKRLRDALYLQAFTALTVSPGARAYYDAHRARGATHHQALRALANRLVGILHGCLRHRTTYREGTAWPAVQPQQLATAA
ncbi:IS110 family transposase [Planosporangium thailandense]|uniref:IS110 family transposase n=1 Tax=Planosporangium thailandense TaxID=765197 RepID=A0ABX0Y8G8_9ACTN|nr:IS110 family transposase [Planosporangium thailandense]